MSAPWVESLLKLQELDMRMRDMETRLSLLPAEMKELVAKRDAATASTAAAADQIRRLDRTIKADEAGVKEREAKIQKCRQQSAMVKKNAEYQAMLNEISRLEKEIGDLESKILEGMDSMKRAKSDGRKLKAANDAAIKAAKAEFDELFSFSKELQEEIAKAQAARPALAEKINRDAYSRYSALLRGKSDDIPLVKVEDGICGNCHMRVTPQALNAIKKGELVSCDNCQRLIYSEDCIY